MADAANPQPLDYRRPPEGRRQYVESDEEKRWRYIRTLFRIGLVLTVAVVEFHFARNYFLYGGLADVTPADFVPFVQQVGVPMVTGIKEYQRDHGGQMPDGPTYLLEPRYLPAEKYPYAIVIGNQFMVNQFGHIVVYDFAPGAEKWEVQGAVAHGVIPFPPVTIPATQPQTHP
jgi:hypothetical protein